MRHVPDPERRARLARRHGLRPGGRLADAEAAARAMTVLHATEPATVHLSVHARVDDVSVADVERALYADRSLVKQLAMRRTLFVFPRDLLPAAWGSASARVAAQLGARLVGEIEASGLDADGAAYLDRAGAAVLARLAGGGALGAHRLREEVPEIQGTVEVRPGTAHGGPQRVAGRVLTQLAVEGRLVRGENGGHWRVSRPQWAAMGDWLDEVPEPWPVADGWAELVRRWLWTFGPGTAEDLQWWLGATKGIVTAALAAVEAVEVGLDGPVPTGWVLPDDVAPVEPVEPWAALLPVLDATVMGWKRREWMLGDHAAALFDRNGNAGTTAWWDGRVVGCWVQDDDGTVRTALLEDVPARARRALEREAARLSQWLDGGRIGTVYPSPAMRAARD